MLAPYERLWARASRGDTNLTRRRIDPCAPEASGITEIKILVTCYFAISAATDQTVSTVFVLDGAVLKKTKQHCTGMQSSE